MEIAVVDKSTIRIKGKNVNFIVDPTSSISKVSSDAILFLSQPENLDTAVSKVADARVVINGPGSYEVNGARISAENEDGKLLYSINIDGINIFLGLASAALKKSDKNACNILILNTDTDTKESNISSFEPSVVVYYGQNAETAVKLLGKEYQAVSKFSQTADKLPQDTLVVLLK